MRSFAPFSVALFSCSLWAVSLLGTLGVQYEIIVSAEMLVVGTSSSGYTSVMRIFGLVGIEVVRMP